MDENPEDLKSTLSLKFLESEFDRVILIANKMISAKAITSCKQKEVGLTLRKMLKTKQNTSRKNIAKSHVTKTGQHKSIFEEIYELDQ